MEIVDKRAWHAKLKYTSTYLPYKKQPGNTKYGDLCTFDVQNSLLLLLVRLTKVTFHFLAVSKWNLWRFFMQLLFFFCRIVKQLHFYFGCLLFSVLEENHVFAKRKATNFAQSWNMGHLCHQDFSMIDQLANLLGKKTLKRSTKSFRIRGLLILGYMNRYGKSVMRNPAGWRKYAR